MHVVGAGNTLTSNTAYSNAGDGYDIAGGTSGSPNKLITNIAGANGKGNLQNGILVIGAGNGTGSPIELDGNTAKGNTLVGIRINGGGTGHQLKNNISGGSSGDNNGGCEFLVVAGNFNATGNKANNATIAGANNSAFPTTCQGSA